MAGGEAGIRTLDTGFGPYNGLANRRLQPLGHLTVLNNSTAVSALRLSSIRRRWSRLHFGCTRPIPTPLPWPDSAGSTASMGTNAARATDTLLCRKIA